MRIPAAGTVPWRLSEDGALEVALVHRPRYDDWAWAKGKLDPNEEWAVAAARETEEETGLRVRLGPRSPRRATPCWAATAPRTQGRPLLVRAGHRRFGPPGQRDRRGRLARRPGCPRPAELRRDQEQLLATARLLQADRLDTWPLALVRHAHAVPRSQWRDPDDTRRPLDRAGKARAADLAPVLAAYGIGRLLSSPSVRCTATVAPYAEASGSPVVTRKGLWRRVSRSAPTRPRSTCTPCSIGPPPLRSAPTARSSPRSWTCWRSASTSRPRGRRSRVEALAEARDAKLAKGEVLVAHMCGRGEAARVVALERHLP